MTDRSKAVHGVDAAGAGTALDVKRLDVLGTCPSCGAELAMGIARESPRHELAPVLLHTIPFCTYFGATEPEDVIRAMSAKDKA